MNSSSLRYVHTLCSLVGLESGIPKECNHSRFQPPPPLCLKPRRFLSAGAATFDFTYKSLCCCGVIIIFTTFGHMKGYSHSHHSAQKDNKSDNTKTSSEHAHDTPSKLDIAGLEQVQRDLSQEEFYHEEIEIDTLQYTFRRDDSSTEGPEFDRICPLCGQFIIQGSYYLVFNSKELKRKFQAHYQCLLNKQTLGYKFVSIPQNVDEAILRQEAPTKSISKSMHLTHSYHASLSISHPLSNVKYMELNKRIDELNSEQVQWHFGGREAILYSPNTICMPFTDFKVTLTIDYRKIVKTYQFLVNLNRRESKKKTMVQATTSNVTLEMDILTLNEDKESVVSQMNFIYPFTKAFPLIRLNQIRIKVPEELEEMEPITSERKCSQQMASTASYYSPSPVVNRDYNPIYNTEEMMHYSRVASQNMMSPHYAMQYSPIHPSQQGVEGYYNDIDELVQTGRIKEYVETNNGSREFQKYLKKCLSEEVEVVLIASYDYLPEFIIHDYANYMFQGLVHACSLQQRIRIIQKIAPDLPVLSQNKKGTHSLQTLITVITSLQESSMVTKALQKDFIMLAENPNATHLIQKIIQTFDVSSLGEFFSECRKEFIRLCKNAFGICVLKTFMKKVQHTVEMVNDIVKVIADSLDVVIQDPFGNYIVQYAFEMFKEEKCKPIVDEIINKFTQYSIQKFSANVIEKCITSYCSNIHSEAVASIIDASSVEELLKTPSGNSILQKLVQEYPDKDIEERIRKILSLPRMSTYANNWDSHFHNHSQKASTCKNINGETFNNFSEAAEMARGGRGTKKGSFTPKMRKF